MSHPDTVMATSRWLPFAPDAIYGAFAAPEALAAWWGPDGFTNAFERFDFREGGEWVFEMIGPDGQRYPNRSVFQRLVPGREVVIRHDCVPYFTLAVRLEAADGGTRLHWEQRFDDERTARAVEAVVRPANEQNLDRLTRTLSAAAGA